MIVPASATILDLVQRRGVGRGGAKQRVRPLVRDFHGTRLGRAGRLRDIYCTSFNIIRDVINTQRDNTRRLLEKYWNS